MRLRHAAYLFGTAAVVALMAGCASKPQYTAQQESSGYLSRAHGSYTPPGPPSDPWGPYVREASGKFDVPEKWIREVMRQESGGHLYGRGGQLITSGAGAMGLMQVMPATYDDLRSRYRELGDDPYDPHNNILAGSAYLREMYDIYGAPGFLAAYNAGPGRLDDYLTRNRILPAETRRYVASIGPRIAGYEPQRPSPGAMYAMNAVPLDIPSGPRYPATQFAATIPTPAEAGPIVVAEAQPTQRFIKLNAPASMPAPEARPVVVAEAQPSQRFIKLNPPNTEAPPFVVANAAPPLEVADAAQRQQQFIKLNPPEPAFGSTLQEAPARMRAPVPFAVAEAEVQAERQALARREVPAARDLPLPEPPPIPPAPTRLARRGAPGAGRSFEGRPVEVAEFAEPRFQRPGRSAASELVALGPQPRGFHLIPSATAAPMRQPATGHGGAWAVQVGAFSNESQAHSATASARERAHDVLSAAPTQVAGVRQQGATLYRARLGGLSRDAANQACERLARARTSCMVVSPESQR